MYYEVKIGSRATEEKSFENVNRRTHRRTDGRTDDRRKVITIAHPEHSSGELKIQKRHKIRKPTFRQVHPAKTYIRLHTGAVLSDAIQMHKEAKLTLP